MLSTLIELAKRYFAGWYASRQQGPLLLLLLYWSPADMRRAADCRLFAGAATDGTCIISPGAPPESLPALILLRNRQRE